VKDIKTKTGGSPTVILESTGHYHEAVIQFLEEQQLSVIVVNPLISHQAKKSSLRKVKTDAVDAYQLSSFITKRNLRCINKAELSC
jgi:transposase